MSKPWVCPVCRRGCAPDVKTCDHGGLTELARQLSDDSMDETRLKPVFVPSCWPVETPKQPHNPPWNGPVDSSGRPYLGRSLTCGDFISNQWFGVTDCVGNSGVRPDEQN